ncbi:hypothetical protein DPSP01_004374 [Paraphaeosphaeria sporulosa]
MSLASQVSDGKCSSRCVLCYIMCLAFPIGTCYFCRYEDSQDELAKISIDEVHKMYDDVTAVTLPDHLCEMLQGNYKADTMPICTIDLSHSENFLQHVTGIDTPKQLCTQVHGSFVNGKCTLNLSQAGQATLDVKQAACASLDGQWADNHCALLG